MSMTSASRPNPEPATLRPMPFGRRSTGDVRNGIWEPLWGGRRALIEVTGTGVRISDEAGEPLDGFELLRDAFIDAVQSDDLVADGYLLPAPLQDTTGLEAEIGGDFRHDAADDGSPDAARGRRKQSPTRRADGRRGPTGCALGRLAYGVRGDRPAPA